VEKSNHPSNLSTEIDRNALLILENYGGYNNRFFLAVFRLMLKIFGSPAKFGGLGSIFA